MARPPRNRPHFLLEGGGQAEPYTSPRVVISGLPPARVRAAHAQRLGQAIGVAVQEARQKLEARDQEVAEGEKGFYLEFEIPVAERAAVEGLENKPAAIELVAVRPVADGDETVSATVFVPERSAEFFSRKIDAYRNENTKTGKPKNEALVARIEDVRLAAVRSLFTDSMALFPVAGQPAWWEVLSIVLDPVGFALTALAHATFLTHPGLRPLVIAVLVLVIRCLVACCRCCSRGWSKAIFCRPPAPAMAEDPAVPAIYYTTIFLDWSLAYFWVRAEIAARTKRAQPGYVTYPLTNPSRTSLCDRAVP